MFGVVTNRVPRIGGSSELLALGEAAKIQALFRLTLHVEAVLHAVSGAPAVQIQRRMALAPVVPNRLPSGALASTYAGKPLARFGTEGLFGELAIVRLLQQDGGRVSGLRPSIRAAAAGCSGPIYLIAPPPSTSRKPSTRISSTRTLSRARGEGRRFLRRPGLTLGRCSVHRVHGSWRLPDGRHAAAIASRSTVAPSTANCSALRLDRAQQRGCRRRVDSTARSQERRLVRGRRYCRRGRPQPRTDSGSLARQPQRMNPYTEDAGRDLTDRPRAAPMTRAFDAATAALPDRVADQ